MLQQELGETNEPIEELTDKSVEEKSDIIPENGEKSTRDDNEEQEIDPM